MSKIFYLILSACLAIGKLGVNYPKIVEKILLKIYFEKNRMVPEEGTEYSIEDGCVTSISRRVMSDEEVAQLMRDIEDGKVIMCR